MAWQGPINFHIICLLGIHSGVLHKACNVRQGQTFQFLSLPLSLLKAIQFRLLVFLDGTQYIPENSSINYCWLGGIVQHTCFPQRFDFFVIRIVADKMAVKCRITLSLTWHHLTSLQTNHNECSINSQHHLISPIICANKWRWNLHTRWLCSHSWLYGWICLRGPHVWELQHHS